MGGKLRRLQDIKLIGFEIVGNDAGEVVWESEVPDGVPIEMVVKNRMIDHFACRSEVQAVRSVDVSGNEICRWTWWDEQQRRTGQGEAAQTVQAAQQPQNTRS